MNAVTQSSEAVAPHPAGAAVSMPAEPVPSAQSTSAARLRVLEGADRGKERVIEGEIIIGTAEQCQLCLTDSTVAPQHVRLQLENGVVKVFDLGSDAGTRYDGVRLIEAELPLGATLQLGSTRLAVLSVEETAPLDEAASRNYYKAREEALKQFEKTFLLDMLERHEQVVTEAARDAGISRRYFYKLLDAHALKPKRD
jgi:DNA-binding NtrC family response regulator